jgi:hypothetical protein
LTLVLDTSYNAEYQYSNLTGARTEVTKYEWIDAVVVASNIDVEAKASAVNLFPLIRQDGTFAPSEIDTSGLELAGYVRDGAISLP